MFKRLFLLLFTVVFFGLLTEAAVPSFDPCGETQQASHSLEEKHHAGDSQTCDDHCPGHVHCHHSSYIQESTSSHLVNIVDNVSYLARLNTPKKSPCIEGPFQPPRA